MFVEDLIAIAEGIGPLARQRTATYERPHPGGPKTDETTQRRERANTHGKAACDRSDGTPRPPNFATPARTSASRAPSRTRPRSLPRGRLSRTGRRYPSRRLLRLRIALAGL